MRPSLPAPPVLGEDEAAAFLSQRFGLAGRLTPLSGERDLNFLVEPEDGSQWVLKLAAADEEPGHLALQVAALRHLEAVDPALPLPRVRAGLSGRDLEALELGGGKRSLARLLSFLPGRAFRDLDRSPALDHALGAYLARLDRGLAGFYHPAAKPDLPWDLQQAPRLRFALERLEGRDRRALLARVLDRAEDAILPALAPLRAQLIHMDATLDNALAEPSAPERMAGLIDFGDMMHQPLVFEPALAAADMLLKSKDRKATLTALVLGYDSVQRLEEAEVAILADLVALRIASVALIIAGGLLGPVDEAALEAELVALEFLETRGTGAVTRELQRALHLPSGQGDLFARRRKVTAQAYEHFYREPLHLVSGRGVILTDSQGRRYIDAYNNVPHVGHCHPRVVNAMARQAERLNINTRYLYDSMVDYAERLTATLPQGLSRCLFLSSGSEANDVAWRMAWAASGAKGALVMEGAYHGVTDLVARLSPSGLVRGEPDPPFLARIHAPYPFRSADRDPEAETRRALDSLDRGIAALQESGQGVAGLIVDMGLTNNGVLDLPPGYLPEAVRRVRAAGGLFIADEVQAGFGRSGLSMWRFQQEGLVPDIVTMGKAIGNGFPMAVTVTSEAVAQAFSDRFYFFSSMGGNPVACAAGLAVLDCLEEEGLQENARVVGRALKVGLEEIAVRHPVVGEVRGQGFLLGADLVEEGRPAPALAKALVEAMRERGVLVGTEGPDGNVVKIRPPLVLDGDQAEAVLAAFEEGLEALGR